MPELPEVETLRRDLERHMVGRKIVDVRVLIPKMLKGTVTQPTQLQQVLQNSSVLSVNRRGKHLIITLHSGYYLLLHLKMRGQLRIVPASAPDEKYLAAEFTLDDGQALRFSDMWTWGEIRLLTGGELETHPPLLEMGQEPFSQEWTPQSFLQSLSRRAGTPIKAVLLDQRIVAGVGNIYADESLFRAGIASLRSAGSLTASEAQSLHTQIRAVLTEATEGGGTTSDNYVDADGQVGRYVPQVYDRGGQPCMVCGETLTRIRIAGRGTVYCAVCQK